MKIANLPQSVMARMLQLESDARNAQSEARDATDALANARKRLNFEIETDVLDGLNNSLPALIQQAEITGNAHTSLTETVERCRRWLDSLPDATLLEPYTPQITEGDPAQALKATREKLTTATKERNALARIPVPSEDIEEKVRDYVAALATKARPYVRGIARNDKLSVRWPPQPNSTVANTLGWPDDTCNPLLMAALLHPDELAQRILDEIEREANEHMPIDQRHTRIATLTDEIEELQRQASDLTYALVQTGDARTYGNAPAEAVLGVIVAEERQAA